MASHAACSSSEAAVQPAPVQVVACAMQPRNQHGRRASLKFGHGTLGVATKHRACRGVYGSMILTCISGGRACGPLWMLPTAFLAAKGTLGSLGAGAWSLVPHSGRPGDPLRKQWRSTRMQIWSAAKPAVSFWSERKKSDSGRRYCHKSPWQSSHYRRKQAGAM